MIMYQSNTSFRWQLQSRVSGYGYFLLQTNLVQSFYSKAEIDFVSKKKSFYLHFKTKIHTHLSSQNDSKL